MKREGKKFSMSEHELRVEGGFDNDIELLSKFFVS